MRFNNPADNPCKMVAKSAWNCSFMSTVRRKSERKKSAAEKSRIEANCRLFFFWRTLRRIRISVGVGDSGFCEDVGESERRLHVVELDFLNTTHGVIFERDVHPCVLLTGHVKQFCRVSDDLPLRFGKLQQRAFALKKNDCGLLPLIVLDSTNHAGKIESFTLIGLLLL